MMQGHRFWQNVAHFSYAIILFLFVMGCNSDKPVDRNAIAEEMAGREIKRVTKAELTEKALEFGSSLVEDANQLLVDTLIQQIDEDGLEKSLEYCANYVDADIESFRTGIRVRNPENEADSLDLLMLEAYQYGKSNGLETPPSIQDVDPEVLLFNAPIFIKDEICLKCHGMIGSEIEESFYDSIVSRYPSDQSTGFKKGELIGIWSIRIPKKLIVQSL